MLDPDPNEDGYEATFYRHTTAVGRFVDGRLIFEIVTIAICKVCGVPVRSQGTHHWEHLYVSHQDMLTIAYEFGPHQPDPG